MKRKLTLILGILALALSAFAFSGDSHPQRNDCPLWGTPLCRLIRRVAVSSGGRFKIQRLGNSSKPFLFLVTISRRLSPSRHFLPTSVLLQILSSIETSDFDRRL